MARNRSTVEATPQQVFEVLLDPYSYGGWVVGAKEVRGVDEAWPAVGSSLHHSTGAGPATVDDRTELLEIRRPEMLRLRAFARPLGIADVTIFVKPLSAGSEIIIEETPTPGTKTAKIAPLLWPLIFLRNIESLRRLKKLIRERNQM